MQQRGSLRKHVQQFLRVIVNTIWSIKTILV